MDQTYSMVFWRKPDVTDIHKMTETVFAVLSALKQFGHYLSPNYLAVNSKSAAKQFDLNIDSIRNVLDENVNREGNKSFTELGRTLSFFSSLNDDMSSGIRIHVGSSYPRINNTVSVDLPIENVLVNMDEVFAFEALFKQIVVDFEPFWACVYSNRSSKKFDDKLWDGSKPTSAHWLNFFDSSVIQSIGESRIKKLSEIEVLSDGYYFKLVPEPFDAENLEHEKLQEKVNIILGL
jgi:hypothetical protein